MRPSERSSGAVWRLLSAWANREREKDPLGRRITQGQMANLFGVADQTVSTWKLCQARMPMASQLRVIKATGISLDELTAALAEDEPRIAEYVAARQAETDQGGGEGEQTPAKTPPGSGPDLRAVASGDEADPNLAAEADRQAARAREVQQRNIREMKNRRRDED